MKLFLSGLFATALGLSSALAITDVSTPTPTPTASPAPTASPSEAKPGDEAEALRKLEIAWGTAVVSHDAAAIDRIEADDFVGTDPTGTVSHKADDLAQAKAADFTISHFQLDDIKVSLYGDAAVLTGRTVFSGTAGDQTIGGKYRWTDVFVRRNGRWQAVASQATTIAEPAAEKEE